MGPDRTAPFDPDAYVPAGNSRDEELRRLSGPSAAELEEIEREEMPALLSRRGILTVPHDDAVLLLVEGDFRTAAKWPVEKIQRYFQDLEGRIPREHVTDPDLLVLYDDVAEANRDAVPVLIGETSPKLRPGPRMGITKAQRKRPGIMKFVLKMLEGQASEDSPLTKEQVFARVKERFPDRDPDSLWTTVYCFPNWAEGYFGVQIHKNQKGYWLTRGYSGKFRRAKNYRTKKRA